MRTVLSLAAAVLLAVPFASAQSLGPVVPAKRPVQAAITKAPIQIVPPIIDMGYILIGKESRIEAKIRNTSDEDVYIARALSDCACAKTQIQGQWIKPGQEIPWVVKYEPRNVPGPFDHKLSLVYGTNRVLDVKLKVVASRAVHAEPFFIDLMTADSEAARRGVLNLRSVDGKPFRVLGIDGKSPEFVDKDGKTISSDAVKAATLHHVKYDFVGVKDDDLPMLLAIETDHPNAPILELRVLHASTVIRFMNSMPIGVTPTHILLGKLGEGDTHDATLTFSGVKPGAISNITTKDGSCQVGLIEEMDTGNNTLRVKLRFTMLRKKSGLVKDKLIFRIANGQQGEVEQALELIGRVEGGQ